MAKDKGSNIQGSLDGGRESQEAILISFFYILKIYKIMMERRD
jgi:hypothetical protein